MVFYLASFTAMVWLISFLLPWQPWRVNEILKTEVENNQLDLSDITVIIPARNEEAVIANTLSALENQGEGLKVIVIDDNSTDNTAKIAKQSSLKLTLINGKTLPKDWTGKLWAQQQGLELVDTSLTLLLDADIRLAKGLIGSLKNKLQRQNLHLVSLMADLHHSSFWEKLLMPAFIYFFKMLYPFSLSNNPKTKVAAAAGGCILVKTDVLREIGAMESLKTEIIDDCSLAKQVKNAGYKTWIGLTHEVFSQRNCAKLSQIWNMVARTAYTQLFYSLPLLILCTFIMLSLYIFPIIGLCLFNDIVFVLSLFSYLLMIIMYSPMLRFYSLNLTWALTMPIIAGLYLLMTWSSAIRYWQGVRSEWKGRTYKH